MISTNPPGLAGSGKSTKDGGGRSAADDEVPPIVILNVGESRSRWGDGRVDACVMHMLVGSTSTEVKGGISNIKGVEGK
jgi:hypothetical protein